MRKLLAAFLTISLNAYAIPPVSVDSEVTAVGNYVQNVKLPNEQATQLTSRNTRVETGNTNLLKNPSFEHMTVGLGWTTTNATPALETSAVVEGKKSLKLTLSGALATTQDSSINAANLVGLQGVSSIKIKTSNVTGLKVCARNAGVTSTSLCVNVTADGTWKHVSIPFIMTATSNGIAITSTGTSGIVYIDDAFVGTSAPFQNVNGAKLLGTVTVSGCSAGWSVASTTFASYGAQTGCVYTTTGQALAPSTNIPAIKFASLPAGDYKIEYVGLAVSPSGQDSYVQFYDGTNSTLESAGFGGSSSSIDSSYVTGTLSYSASQTNVTIQARGKVASGTTYIFGTTAIPATIRVWYFPPESKIYSQASQDYGWTPYTPTFTGIGTPSSVSFFHKRVGDTLYIQGSAVTGTVAASGMSMSLPGSLAIDSSRIPSGSSYVGSWARAAINAPDYGTVLAFSTSTSALFFGREAVASFNALDGNAILASTEKFSLFAAVPIQGWSNYGVIVGSFAGYTEDSKIVSASYWLSSNFAASTTTPINFDTKEWDNCNPSCVTTSSTAWKFTAPTSGVYSISGFSNITTTTNTVILVYKNGSALKTLTYNYQGQANFFGGKVRLLAGDYIDIRPNISVTITGGSLSTAGISHFSISRIGPY